MTASKAIAATCDRKGRIICPACGDTGVVPHDRWVTVGLFPCEKGHQLMMTDEIAYEINSILSKTREGAWRKDNLKRFEGTPKAIKPEQQKDGRIIF
jgi:hypothetical protein